MKDHVKKKKKKKRRIGVARRSLYRVKRKQKKRGWKKMERGKLKTVVHEEENLM